MKDILKYKDFIGSVHYSSEDDTLFGKIEGIHDLVTFEGKSVTALRMAFQEAVDDYVELCKRKKKDPHKSFRGTFNVRIKPTLHRKAMMVALSEGISLNQLVQKAIEKEVQRV